MTIPLSFRRTLATLLALAVVVAFAGCRSHARRPPVLAGGPESGAAGRGTGTDSAGTGGAPQRIDEGPDVAAIQGEGASASDLANAGVEGEGGPLSDVRFELDSASLSEEARATLEKHAAWLQSHRDVKVVVEGHCDERGTVEYNLALGEQRARAARDYLASLGVAAERLRTVSYGKERPLDTAATEQAYARNRRDHFAVTR